MFHFILNILESSIQLKSSCATKQTHRDSFSWCSRWEGGNGLWDSVSKTQENNSNSCTKMIRPRSAFITRSRFVSGRSKRWLSL